MPDDVAEFVLTPNGMHALNPAAEAVARAYGMTLDPLPTFATWYGRGVSDGIAAAYGGRVRWYGRVMWLGERWELDAYLRGYQTAHAATYRAQARTRARHRWERDLAEMWQRLKTRHRLTALPAPNLIRLLP